MKMRREKDDSGREDRGKNQGYQRVANVVFFCVVNLWVITKLGTMERGERGLGGWNEECL